MYNFYAWPMSQRPRLAQVLVVPPYQGAGIGKALLLAAYQLAKERDAVDLTFGALMGGEACAAHSPPMLPAGVPPPRPAPPSMRQWLASGAAVCGVAVALAWQQGAGGGGGWPAWQQGAGGWNNTPT